VAVSVQAAVFCDMALCSSACGYQHYKHTYYLHLHSTW